MGEGGGREKELKLHCFLPSEESQVFSYALAFGVKHCPSQAFKKDAVIIILN